jgi:hypothetical protein
MKTDELGKMEKTVFSTKVQIFLGLTENFTCSNPFAFRCRSVAPCSILFPIPLRFVAVLLRFVAVWFHALQKWGGPNAIHLEPSSPQCGEPVA